MKQLYLFQLVIFLSFSITAQQEEWAPIGATWHYETQHFFGGPYLPNRIECVGDTIINGQSARVLVSERVLCNALFDWDLVYFTFSEGEKVYYYNDHQDEFQLWYDFTVEPGEEWLLLTNYVESDPSWDTTHVRVDAVDSVDINGCFRKRLLTTFYTISYYQPVADTHYLPQREIIWPIGDLSSQLHTESGFCDGDYAIKLRCYEDVNCGLYKLVDYPCDTIIQWTNADEQFGDFRIEISPNPTNAKLDIKFPVSINEVQIAIYRIDGRLVESIPIINGAEKINIDLSAYAAGIYLIQVHENGIPIASEKVIKN